MAHGGLDDWLRVPHTLVSLGRLADRGFITQTERSDLSDAYYFLRCLEHRLQMEHGLQTHTVPEVKTHRRSSHAAWDSPAADDFAAALKTHTTNVRSAYDRLFSETEESAPAREEVEADGSGRCRQRRSAGDVGSPGLCFAYGPALGEQAEIPGETIAGAGKQITQSASRPGPGYAYRRISRKNRRHFPISEANLETLLQLCGSSDSFAETIAANPALIGSLGAPATASLRRDYRAILRAAVDAERSFPAELAALRLQWAELMVEIGAHDAMNELSIFEANHLQTDLATASMNVAYLVARREMARRYGSFSGGPRVAFYGLGRLGTSGVDYGSDLDILITYDSLVPSPIKTLTQDETYSRLVELMIAALSSITREGYLYRIDTRLRPHGKDGPLVTSSEGFLDYLKSRVRRGSGWPTLSCVVSAAIRSSAE